jgi:hypothetical protein
MSTAPDFDNATRSPNSVSNSNSAVASLITRLVDCKASGPLPTIAILQWDGVLENFLDPLRISLESRALLLCASLSLG